MALFAEYTLSLLDNDKISVDFADTIASDYEKAELLRFFKKYKREVYIDFIDFDGYHIFCMVLPWRYWVEFLMSLGFEDTAKATIGILNDLDADRPYEGPSVEEYLKQLKNATMIKDDKRRGDVVIRKPRDWESLKKQEIKRLTCKEEEDENDDAETDDEKEDDTDEDVFVKF